jgi:hypothetical protein
MKHAAALQFKLPVRPHDHDSTLVAWIGFSKVTGYHPDNINFEEFDNPFLKVS